MMKKILIAEDYDIVIKGLQSIFDEHFKNFRLVKVKNNKSIIAALEEEEFEYAIFDLKLEEGSVMEILSTIFRHYPAISVLIFSAAAEEIYGKRVLQLGAKGFLHKSASESEIINALNVFLRKRPYVSLNLGNLLLNDISKKQQSLSPFALLSNREIEVMTHIMSGKSLKEIAKLMNIGSNTVATYKVRIYQKTRTNSLIELIRLAEAYDVKL